jgi:hypothetical protein
MHSSHTSKPPFSGQGRAASPLLSSDQHQRLCRRGFCTQLWGRFLSVAFVIVALCQRPAMRRRHRMLAISSRAAEVASSTGQTLNHTVGVRALVSEVSIASATSNASPAWPTAPQLHPPTSRQRICTSEDLSQPGRVSGREQRNRLTVCGVEGKFRHERRTTPPG